MRAPPLDGCTLVDLDGVLEPAVLRGEDDVEADDRSRLVLLGRQREVAEGPLRADDRGDGAGVARGDWVLDGIGGEGRDGFRFAGESDFRGGGADGHCDVGGVGDGLLGAVEGEDLASCCCDLDTVKGLVGVCISGQNG